MLASNRGLILLGIIIVSFLTIAINPNGDEPDYSIRAPQLFNLIKGVNFFEINDLVIDYIKYPLEFRICNIDATNFSLSADIYNCSVDLDVALFKLLIYLVIYLPFIALLFYKSNKNEINLLKKCSIVAFFFSGFIYYTTLTSVESLTLLLSLIGVVYINSIAIIVIAMIISFRFDFGNTLVSTLFFLSYFIYNHTINKKIVFYIFLAILIVCVSFGVNILSVINGYINNDELANIIYKIQNDPTTNSYPIILKPLLTLMTISDMKQSNLKVPSVSLLFYWYILFSLLKLKYTQLTDYKNFLNYAIPSVFTCLFFIFLFPTYTNAKYYIFMLPIFFIPSIKIWNLNNTIFYILFINFLYFITLIFYRL